MREEATVGFLPGFSDTKYTLKVQGKVFECYNDSGICFAQAREFFKTSKPKNTTGTNAPATTEETDDNRGD